MKTSTNPPIETQGTDAAKLLVGRNRSIVTAALGLLLAVIICAAWVDQDFKNKFVEHAAPSESTPKS